MAWRIPSMLVSCKENIMEEAEDNWTMENNLVKEKRREVTERHQEAQAKV